jgi:hypothetical protein
MYTQEDIASMSATDLQEGLELFFADCDAALLQQTAVLIKSGKLTWEQVEEVIGVEPDAGLAALVASAG